MRLPLLASVILAAAFLPNAHARKPLIGAPKSIAIPSSGVLSASVVGAQPGMGGYVKGATQVAVPLVAVAFESMSEARTSTRFGETATTRTLKLRLDLDAKTQQAIAEQLQAIVEADLKAQGFEVLPRESIDADPRWQGIAKITATGEEVKDNFASGFMGNGSFNRWFTSGERPLFGTGATGALSELSPLIHIARERKIALLFYRFKVQFSEIDSNNGMVFNYVEGKNLLHMMSADMAVFTPKNTLGGMVKLKADLTAGSDYVKELQTRAKGDYRVVADPQRYTDDSLLLIKATSRQFAEFLKKSQ
jgi:hypothetical protein